MQRGRVLGLLVRPGENEPVRLVQDARGTEGGGLEGDHAGGGARGVTLLDPRAWGQACQALGRDVPWHARRANVLVEGLDLLALLGRRLRLGGIELLLVGETRPCQVMDEAAEGLQEAPRPAGRAGVHGRLLRSGTVRLGDVVEVLETPREQGP